MDDSLDMIWKALADPTRRTLLDLMRDRPQTTGELSAAFPDLTRYAVMKHLRVLVDAELVLVRRDGRTRWNALNAVPLRRVYEHWVGQFADLWAGGLLRLKKQSEWHTTQAEKEPPMPIVDHTAQPRNTIVESEVVITAPRADVYRVILYETTDWFWPGTPDDRHPPSKIEPWVGGRFWRDHSNEHQNNTTGDNEPAGELYAIIGTLKPNELIRLVGNFGSESAFAAVITITLTDDTSHSTRVHVTHRCSGDVPDDLVHEFDVGWRDELASLKRYIESHAK